VRETIYGPTSEEELSDDAVNFYRTRISTKALTDLEISYRFTKSLTVALGANNLFNTYPNKYNAQLTASQQAALDNAAVSVYPTFSPFGINGGYYYARATYTF
jgi:iron complex outermembrane receptor protein